MNAIRPREMRTDDAFDAACAENRAALGAEIAGALAKQLEAILPSLPWELEGAHPSLHLVSFANGLGRPLAVIPPH